MRKLFLVLALLLCSSLTHAQGQGNTVMVFSGSAFSGACSGIMLGSDIVNSNLYWCAGPGYTWVKLNGSGGPPTGTAGGDLSGAYPNPGVAKVNGVALPTLTASTGFFYDTNGTLSLITAIPNGTTATTQSQNNNSTNVATTAYTDLAVANGIAGVNPAIAVLVATTAAGDTSAWTYANGASGIGATFTGPTNTVITIDGVTFTTVGQRLLVKNDTQSPSGAFNGIYQLTALHTGITGDIYTRVLDYDTPSDMNNTGAIPVQSGTANISTSWLMTAQIVTVGTTPLTFTQFSYAPNSCGSLPALTGNVTSSSGSCSTTVAAVPAAALPAPTTAAAGGSLAISRWSFQPAGVAATTTGSATTQNHIVLTPTFIPVYVQVSNISFDVLVADNSANVYDIGLYGPGCAGGASNVPLAVHISATGLAGSSIGGGATGVTQLAFTSSNVTLAPGDYCYAFTSSAASPLLKLGVVSSGTNYVSPFNSGSITGGGATLPGTITAPATAITANANVTGGQIYK